MPAPTLLPNPFDSKGLGSGLAPELRHTLALSLGVRTGMYVYAESLYAENCRLFFLGKRGDERLVGCLAAAQKEVGIAGQAHELTMADGTRCSLIVGPTNGPQAERLRQALPFLRPIPCALAKSAGTGDRLGVATPGHIRAFRATAATLDPVPAHPPIFPILAQQSIRENDRTGRTPQAVIDDAMWGVMQCGWTHGYGADADHLKTTADVDLCHSAGYTFFTVDPGDRVDDEANTAGMQVVSAKAAALDWELLDSSPADLVSRLAGQVIDLETGVVTLSEEDVLRSAAKYGPALAHTVRMSRHLAALRGKEPYDLEMSVDETATITSLAEHVYLAYEMRRLQVPCVSVAPRYSGMFEKGVDFIGDLDEFARTFAEHVAVSRLYGPYKLSLHSGSDKFSIYRLATAIAGNLIHLKTAGTSYLEAVRTVGYLEPDLFRSIMDFAMERYETDRQAYHVSAQKAQVPAYALMPDTDLTSLLEDFHARQVLHVTFGSVLNHAQLFPALMTTLQHGEETYGDILQTHFEKHLHPFL